MSITIKEVENFVLMSNDVGAVSFETKHDPRGERELSVRTKDSLSWNNSMLQIGDFYIYQFRLPSIEDGEVVKLKEEDIISKWVVKDNPAYYKQGGLV